MTEPIRARVEVRLPPEEAWATFTERFGAWWPREFSWSGDVLEGIGIEPRVGGLCWERGPYGFRVDWGRVIAWQPPRRFAITWQVGPDREPQPSPSRASEVVVTFTPTQRGTAVKVLHDGWDRHGPGGGAYRDAMDAGRAWPRALEAFAADAALRAEAPWVGLTT